MMNIITFKVNTVPINRDINEGIKLLVSQYFNHKLAYN